MDLREDQIQRYARHILLDEVGAEGQEKILNARVLVVGAGGLGSPVLMYLAAAGVGTIGIVDDDVVDLSNLQRQVIHATSSVGKPKVESAKAALKAINPDVNVITHQTRIDADNALDLIANYDIVADGSDNFETRFLVNDACALGKKTLVSAAILRFDAQVSVFKPHVHTGDDHYPCYRCLFREPPPPGQIPTCAEAGVMGALCGTVGGMQATEILKEILDIGETLAGRFLILDALSSEIQVIAIKADPDCPLCGNTPTITSLEAHAGRTGPVCAT